MNNNDAVFKLPDNVYEEVSFLGDGDVLLNDEDHEIGDYPDYCAECSDIRDFLYLTDAMVEEINELRAEVVRWRQVLIKYLPSRWADGLQQDIFDNIYLNDYEDFDAYTYYVNRCCSGKDPFDNCKRAKLMARLSKGTDKTSITYL